MCNARRWLVRVGTSWRMLPPGARWALPPWLLVYYRAQHRLAAEAFDDLVADLWRILRLAEGHAP